DPDDRTEQSNERGHTRGRREKREPPLELVDLGGCRTDERTVNCLEALEHRTWLRASRIGWGLTGQAELGVDLGVAGLEYSNQGALRQRGTDGMDIGELLTAAKDIKKRRGLECDAAIGNRLKKNDRPGND